MRLFAALELPTGTVEHADGALAPVRERHPQLHWVPPTRWHLTLAFYGEVADRKVDALVAKVDRAVAGRAPMSLRLEGSGQFARRALWLGVTGDRTAMGSLARQLSVEQRPYRPHLTVARLRGAVDARPASQELRDYVGPTWLADTVHLVRSRLGPSPTYDDIATFPLEGPAAQPVG